MRQLVLYIHGKGGNAMEANHYKTLFAGYDVVGLDYHADNPFFISPIVDMEKLILDMMGWADITEEKLREKQLITTGFGETLSWEYLCYVRNHPVNWSVPTYILYGDKDNLTSQEIIHKFANDVNAELTIMQNGEHWFHTAEQMSFLDDWIKKIHWIDIRQGE